MSARDEIHRMIDELPDEVTGEVLDFVAAVRVRSGGKRVVPTNEDGAWLGADLSRLGDLDPEDDIDPGEGEPIRWDDERGEFMVGG